MLRSVARSLQKVVVDIAAISNIIGVVAVSVMVLVTVGDVIGRRFFSHPIVGSLEIVRFMMAVAIFLTIGYAQIHGDHISCDVLFRSLSRKIQLIVEKITLVLSLGLWLLIAWQLGKQAIGLWTSGESSMLLRIPTAPFYLIAGFGSGLLAVIILIQLFSSPQAVTETGKGNDES